MVIPDELVEQVTRGDVVLFVGAGLSQGAGLPGWRALLEPLADRIDLPANHRTDLLKVAQHYETERGRRALIEHLIEQTDTTGKRPTDNHYRLQRLGLRVWITTNFDNLIEKTFDESGTPFTKILRDVNLSYARTDRVTLVKLHGEREQPDTLVITESDFHTAFRQSQGIKSKLVALLMEKTFFFVGYSLSDPDFMRILAEVAFDLKGHDRRAYTVLFDADHFTVSDLRQRNIHVLNIDMGGLTNHSERLGTLLDELLQQCASKRRPAEQPPPPDQTHARKTGTPPTASVTGDDPLAREAQTYVAGLSHEIAMSQYCVVGSYIRFEEHVRDTLKDARRRITQALSEPPGPVRENYLIWAAPGSGKTYFVEQVAASLAPDIHYEVLNLAQGNEEQFRSGIARLAAETKPCLCFIDECDATPQGWNPYELLLPYLDARVERGLRLVFVLAGSSGTQVSDMKQRMAMQVKGKDLLSRIPFDNHYEIAPFSLGDRLLVVLSQFWQAGQKLGRSIQAVEKLALYYVARHQHLKDARQLQEFAARAVKRMPPGEDRVQYDHLFDAGNLERYEFGPHVAPALDGFWKKFVTLTMEVPQTSREPHQHQRDNPPAGSENADVDPEHRRHQLYEDLCLFDDVQWQELLDYLGLDESELAGSSRPTNARALIDQMERWLSQLESKVQELSRKKSLAIEQAKQASIANILQTHVSFDNWREVIEQGEKLLRSEPDHQDVRAQTARAYGEHAAVVRLLGNRVAAIESLTRAIELDPQAEYYGERGVNYALEGDHQSAMADCERAIAMEPGRADCYLWRASVYALNGDNRQALDDLTRAVELVPDHAAYYHARAQIHRQTGDHEAALSDINRAIDRAIDLSPDYDLQKEAYYTLAIELGPEHPSPYKGRGRLYLERREYEAAIKDLTSAIAHGPNDAEVYDLRGVSHYHQSDYDQAIEDFTAAIALDPGQARYAWFRAASYEGKGDLARADSDYRRAAELDPQEASALYQWQGKRYQDRQDYDRAIAEYSRAIELSPEASAYLGRGESLQRKGDYLGMTDDFTHALRLKPELAYYCYSLVTRSNTPRTHQLVNDLLEKLGVHRQEAVSYYIRGLMYKDRGEIDRARDDFQRAFSGGFTGAAEELR